MKRRSHYLEHRQEFERSSPSVDETTNTLVGKGTEVPDGLFHDRSITVETDERGEWPGQTEVGDVETLGDVR